MAIGDVYQSTLMHRATAIGQNMLSVVHHRVLSFSGTEATPTQVATHLQALWRPRITPLMSDGAEFAAADAWRGVRMRRVLPTVSAPIVVSLFEEGQVTDAPLPSQISLPCTLRSSSAPAGIRGRIFFPRGVAGHLDASGKPSDGYKAAVLSLAIDFLGTNLAVPAGGADETIIRGVVYSRKNAEAYIIDNITVEEDWGQIRRRSGLNRADSQPM